MAEDGLGFRDQDEVDFIQAPKRIPATKPHEPKRRTAFGAGWKEFSFPAD